MNVDAVEHVTVVNGADIAWFEWGDPDAPLLLLSHATGLHARCWDEVVSYLDDHHVIATEHRGHGRSSNNPPYGWNQFGADLTAFIVALDLQDIRGVGHSMGGHCMVQAAANEPDRFAQLTLFDPVIFAPQHYSMHAAPFETEHPVARRRNDWQSPQQMYDAFSSRKPFSRWHENVLRNYCEFGLERTDDGFRLACPPDIEAGIYLSSMSMQIYDRIPMVDVPVTVVRGESQGFEAAARDFSLSPTWPQLAAQFPHGKDSYLPEYSHFMPLENPALAASIIVREAAGRTADSD